MLFENLAWHRQAKRHNSPPVARTQVRPQPLLQPGDQAQQHGLAAIRKGDGGGHGPRSTRLAARSIASAPA
jgi:hypothetical protein